ncbi:tRNA (N(6)-L-threonylcarbamoyladenosine(37)-C(2))-methylthiotransferase MtaB [Candidatus Kuenenbacteria bacterium]|nr:tRNA (N(6)-L-threonylcarbamoyladenosine(37)-C(2))-methylthiotransferase MtaB [Candidatus Kuenenbacteria bacterium]
MKRTSNYKFQVITYGCKLNQAESEMISADLISLGLQMTTTSSADFFIINSCSVTEKAESEVIKKLKIIKNKYPNSKIILTGCFAKNKLSGIDLRIKDKRSFVREFSSKFKINQNARDLAGELKTNSRHPHRTFVKIQDGCNNFCAYCIVPILRGLPQSRGAKDIIQDINEAEKQGLKEVVLTGVNVGLYHGGLVKLLKIILAQTNIPRIRLGSLWPTNVTPELIDLYAKESRLCPHFHLSIQSGSNQILKSMGRQYTREEIFKIIKSCRAKIKNINFTCDIIVGFPGETAKDFQDTCDLIQKIGFSKVHIFQFSPRPNTRAAKMPDQIIGSIKQARYQKLSAIAKRVAGVVKINFKNKKLPVLWEGLATGYQYGFTDNYLRIKKKIKLRENWENRIEYFIPKQFI